VRGVFPLYHEPSDMCRTGDYRERGIWAWTLSAEYVVDREQYVVRVPSELKVVGVLGEPLPLPKKHLTKRCACSRTRLPDAPSTPDCFSGARCLVAGLGRSVCWRHSPCAYVGGGPWLTA